MLRRAFALTPLLLIVWAASGPKLLAPSRAFVGEKVEIRGENLPAGSFLLEVQSPLAQSELPVQVTQGSFQLSYTPKSAGLHTLKLKLPHLTLQAHFSVSPAAIPVLQKGALVVGSWRLPLSGTWLGPLVIGTQAYIAQGPLVLQIDLTKPAVVAHYYPPAGVSALELDPTQTGPILVLNNGETLPLSALGLQPYQGHWKSLEVIPQYWQTLKAHGALSEDQSPSTGLPYWVYLVQDPTTLTPTDLEDFGIDLLQRTHRPELPWGHGVMRYLQAWVNQAIAVRAQGLQASLTWSNTLLAYMPLFPGSLRFFQSQENWLVAQGRPDLALRYREALRELRSWEPPWGPQAPQRAAEALGGLYLLAFLYLILAYIPAQRAQLRSVGGWFFGWFRHPLVRLRHNALAYASWGERLLLFLLFLLTLGALVVWGIDQKVSEDLSSSAFARATLQIPAAQTFLQSLPSTPETDGILGYALQSSHPQEAHRLLEQAAPWPYVLLDRGSPQDLQQAEALSPEYPALLQTLGLGGDLWTASYASAQVTRRGVPTPRTLWLALQLTELRSLGADPLHRWLSLPIFASTDWAWIILIAAVLLFLDHLLSFLLPRPRGAGERSRWRQGIQLFFPGSPWYGQAWGVILLLAVGLGLWAWFQEGVLVGLIGAIAAFLLHLLIWLRSLRRLA